jgi:hypothetical protein
MSPFTLFIFQWVMPVYSVVALTVCAFAFRAMIRDHRQVAAGGADAADEPAAPAGARRGSR